MKKVCVSFFIELVLVHLAIDQLLKQTIFVVYLNVWIMGSFGSLPVIKAYTMC